MRLHTAAHLLSAIMYRDYNALITGGNISEEYAYDDYSMEAFDREAFLKAVEEKIIDERPEWRAFTPEERGRRARTGGPLTTTVHDMGFATAIDYSNKDAAGRKLMGKRQELVKLRKWQARTRILTSMDRNLAQAMNELERLGDLLNLPSHVKEEAARIYREAVEKGLVRGRSIESVIAAAVYVACRELKVPRSLDEVSRHTRIGRKDIARCYRLLLRELDIKVGTTDPVDYVPRIVHALGLPCRACGCSRLRGVIGARREEDSEGSSTCCWSYRSNCEEQV
jgi:transcription initiation factor TFIIB